MKTGSRSLRGRFAKETPLAVLLLATVGLAGWLGYEALNLARSQQSVVEGPLRDYSRWAAEEMLDEVEDGLDDVLYDVFREVEDRLDSSRRRPPSLSDVGEGLADAMDDQDCSRTCVEFRTPLAMFRTDLATGEVEVYPDSLAPVIRAPIIDRVPAEAPGLRRTETGFFSARLPGPNGGQPVSVGYFIRRDPGYMTDVTFGFVVSAEAMATLVGVWYEDDRLLPDWIAEDQPNDSLIYLTFETAEGDRIFSSSSEIGPALAPEIPLVAPQSITETVPLQPELGSFVIRASVRPEKANAFIPGGLPTSRLPLLSFLLLLTMGVGVAALIQLRRQQHFQRLRDDFVSGVSHELRTPLAQIRMFSELQETGRLQSEDDRRRANAVIHRESRRLTHLVENILQFSSLRRTHGQGMPRERIDISEALVEGIDAVTPLLEDRGMRITVDAQPGLPVVANREAVTRIIVNLLDNAVKYGPAGQTVRVGVERVNGSARVSVSDQGPGVPTQDRDRVWSAYKRLERDVKAQLPGTGIGLSVVKELAALHEGRTWVEDAEGGGARFVVELPVAVSVTGSGQTEAPTPGSNGHREAHAATGNGQPAVGR